MRQFDFAKIYPSLLTPETVALLGQIHEYRGEQTLFMKRKSDSLTSLSEIAKIQSTEASNKIEGISTSDERLKKLVQDKTTPRNRSEEEIAGYRDVLGLIHESSDYIPPKASMVLQLHQNLYKFSGADFGGRYKVQDIQSDWQDSKPVPARETPAAIEQLCQSYEKSLENGAMDPLLLIPVFVLDFLCIHPFNDGNGRMSRLLTLLLLYREGYVVGKYISIEKLMEESKETYCQALQESSRNWHEGENDYLPFVSYMLGVVAAAYREFSSRVKLLTTAGGAKPDRIREVIKNHPGEITKAQLMAQCPDISLATVQRSLADLQKSGDIIKLGGGRYTAYTWNREKE